MPKHIINNRGGRPRMAPYKKCSVSLSLRIPPALDAYITEQAREKYHGKRNDYIRAALRGQWVRELVTPEFNKLLHDISNLGNNVKDMRDWFHTHGYESKMDLCNTLLEDLSMVLQVARHHRDLVEKELEITKEVVEQENRKI